MWYRSNVITSVVGKRINVRNARRMKHRGQTESIWQSEKVSVTLGHVRLAIQDLSDAGAQPCI